MQNFQALGAPPPNPRASGGWGLCPQTPNSLQRLGAPPPDPPQLRISGYVPATLCPLFIIIWVFVGFCFEQCFLDRSVANLITIDVCLIVFCLKSFICITHCVTLTPSCYITLSYLFAKVLIAKKFLMSLFKTPPIEKSCVRHWLVYYLHYRNSDLH